MQILESTGERILVADEQGRTIGVNAMARRISGRSSPEADRRTLPLPPSWAKNNALFCEDGVTLFPLDATPLTRALRGEPTDQIAMYIREPRAPRAGAEIKADACRWARGGTGRESTTRPPTAGAAAP